MRLAHVGRGAAVVVHRSGRRDVLAADALDDRAKAVELWGRVVDIRGEDAIALSGLADEIGGESLGRHVRELLVASPPPADADAPDVVDALRATYDAHERAVVVVAAHLDATL